MKKKLALLTVLVLMACTLSGCGYFPTALLSDMLSTDAAGSTQSTTAEENGDTVTISREEYEAYIQETTQTILKRFSEII